METPLYCALLLATLLLASRGRPTPTGAAAGLAFLTRPDAVLVAAPAAWLLRRSSGQAARTRNLIRAALASLVVAGPWLLFAWNYFDSPLPHSIEAKRLIHASAPAEVLAEFGRFVRDDSLLIAAVPLAAWAVLVAVRRSLGRERERGGAALAVALAAFMAIYLGAYSFGGITPFPWYVNPLIPPCVILAVAGLASFAARAGLGGAGVWCVVSAALGSALFFRVAGQAPALRSDWNSWEGAYEETARFVLRDSRPGDRVFVGEVGVVGYKLPGRIILDSSGINSPEISRIRTGRREDDPEWSREIVRRLAPDYIATSIDYLNIRTLSSEEWFLKIYERVSPPAVEAAGQIVFRRRR